MLSGTETMEGNRAQELDELFPDEETTDNKIDEKEIKIKKKEEREKAIEKIISSIKKDLQVKLLLIIYLSLLSQKMWVQQEIQTLSVIF